MRFNPRARLDTDRVQDVGGGRGGGLGGGGMRLPMPGGAKAGGGIGGLLIILLIFVLAQCTGIDITGGGGPTTSPGGGFDTSRAAGDSDRYANCRTGADANADVDCARIAVENSLFDYWSNDLQAQSGARFQPASMITFTGGVTTDCGQASSQVGPFYCPADATIYLDTTFFDDVLERQLGGPEGGFVEPYVLAHEYGHHIQNLLGTMGRVRTQQGPRSDAVRLELQADCYAGMWARAATRTEDEAGIALVSELSDEDIQQAIEAAEAVGDDRIQQKTQGQVTEESWTHGSAAQRVQWFRTGFDQGSMQACDTFATDAL
jgi:predicted metalloprotease